MMTLLGIKVSAGIATGSAYWLRTVGADACYRAGNVAEEKAKLIEAAADGARQLRLLTSRVDEQAAAIIDFQLALLDDASFLDAAISRTESGESGLHAWTSVIESEIADYRSRGDEQLSARADDLFDLGERIKRSLHAAPALFSALALPSGAGDIILVADNLTPSLFLDLDLVRIRGIATAKGSPASHVAILARSRGLPMIAGCGERLDDLADGDHVFLDADAGTLSFAVGPGDTTEFVGRLERRTGAASPGGPLVTLTGERVNILVNIDGADAIDSIDAGLVDGVGLFRTEFLFSPGAFPGEDEQYGIYRRVVEWASDRPVTIRMLDAGGDKPIEGVTFQDDRNPFLGIRGIRLLRYRPDIFEIQMRALARAALHGDLRIMVPMVSVPAELEEFNQAMLGVIDRLRSGNVACRLPQIGMMVEVPSAALCASDFAADFYSIGTNDLIQYTLAAARDDYRLNYLSRGDNPAVLALISQVVHGGRLRGVEVGICGDMASDPAMVGHLLKAGIRSLSVAPAALEAVRQCIARWPEDISP